MSNKIVPGIYRSVIDEVMAAIKPEFEEYGVSEDVLAELQSKWEHKVIASHVADFETQHAAPHPPQHHPYPAHPMHMIQSPYGAPPYVQPPPGPPGPGGVKTEPVEPRYMLGSQPIPYIPPLPGPQLNGARQSQQSPQYGGQTSVLSFPPGPPPVQALPTNGAGIPLGRPYVPPTAAVSAPAPAPASSSTAAAGSAAGSSSGGGGSGGRIPQLDGPASDDSDEDDGTPPPLPYAPRSTHPSLPQPQSQATTSKAAEDPEAINSDLDDSDEGDDDEAEDGGAGEGDIVFCTYDKVARVKNKWKCILKDGMIHVNGKDYLFSKCTGEFEW